MRRAGDVMFKIQDGCDELCGEHDMQKHEVLSLVSTHIDNHWPGAIEEYQDGTSPISFYGPLETFVKLYKDRILEILSEDLS
jgi:hypothetical protein